MYFYKIHWLPSACRWLLAGLLLLLLVSCDNQKNIYRESIYAFGSLATIDIIDSNETITANALSAIASRLALRHRQWHPWQADSALVKVNQALANGEKIKVTDSIANALQLARPLVKNSDGYFDPTIGGLIALWGFHTSEYPVKDRPPDRASIEAWLTSNPSINDLQIDLNHHLHSSNRAVKLDLNGFAEGLAIIEINQILNDHGIQTALINLGGDIFAIDKQQQQHWRVGIRDPFGQAGDDVIGGVKLNDSEALFSSGGYGKYRIATDGSRWPHVLNRYTGEPAHQVAATTVLHRNPVLADAASTALMAAGPTQFMRLTKRLGLGCAMLITADDQLLITRALAQRMQWIRRPKLQLMPIDHGSSCVISDSLPTAAHSGAK